MTARTSVAAIVGAAGAAVCLAVLIYLAPAGAVDHGALLYPKAVGLLIAISVGYMVWRLEPAYSISAAVLLSPFAGNWPRLGIPGPLSPDRLLLAGGILAVLVRSVVSVDGPRLRLTATHALLAAAVLYALASAYFAGTLLQNDAFLRLVDTFGIMPFLLFLTAPLAFRTQRQRGLLLVTFVALGAYLGLTVVFETVKLDALVFPRYILDAHYGIHAGRGRGPFVEAVTNGLALFTCAVVCAIAVAEWQGKRARILAGAIGLLCLVGVFLCLERSVWIGAGLATCVGMLVTRGARRYLVPLLIAVGIGVGATLMFVPGLHKRVIQRVDQKETLWDRRNLARAAINMVDARPLVGFGWARFQKDSADYFQQAADYPLSATSFGVHNTPLAYAADLGLIGVTLWALGLLCGVGSALLARGPPDLLPWRIGLLTVAVATLVVISAVPPSAWPNRAIWLLAGVVCSGRYRSS
ncbi:MAG: O-antigen ligase family protein [Solirubrobacteraceae bacterium]